MPVVWGGRRTTYYKPTKSPAKVKPELAKPIKELEGGRPELFNQDGKTYLIPGDAGSVRPVTAGLALKGTAVNGGPIQVVINNHSGGQVSAREDNQAMPDGSMLRKLVIDVVADDLANGGQVASAGRSRFGWSDQV